MTVSETVGANAFACKSIISSYIFHLLAVYTNIAHILHIFRGPAPMRRGPVRMVPLGPPGDCYVENVLLRLNNDSVISLCRKSCPFGSFSSLKLFWSQTGWHSRVSVVIFSIQTKSKPEVTTHQRYGANWRQIFSVNSRIICTNAVPAVCRDHIRLPWPQNSP